MSLAQKPKDLSSLCQRISLQGSEATIFYLRPLLLQPLVNPELLARCRNPGSVRPIGDDPGDEYLDLEALKTHWREEWQNPPHFMHLRIEFDV